jgi:hypothetical protein
MNKIVDMAFDAPSRANPAVPAELDAIALRALERHPQNRFQTALEMRQALEKHLRKAAEFPGEAEIAALVAQVFGAERSAARRDIHGRMTELESERGPVAEGGALALGGAREPLHGGAPEARTVEPESPATLTVAASSRPLRVVRTNDAPGREPRRARGGRTAGLVGASLVLIAGIVSARHPSPSLRLAGTTQDASSVPTAVPVHVVVRASPAGASIDLDGAPVTNPFQGTFPRDELEHRIRAACPGYSSATQLARFDRDEVTLVFALERAPADTPPPSTTAAAPPSPPARAAWPSPGGPAQPGAKRAPKLDDDRRR